MGDPIVTDLERDWRRLTETVGLFADPAREVWRVEGPGAVRALHGLLTNDLEGPAPGSRIPALALTPKGRPLADLLVWKQESFLLLDLPRVTAASLRAHFGRYLPPRLARLTEEPAAGIARLLGPGAGAALGEPDAPSSGPPVAGPDAPSPVPGPLLVAPREPEEGGGYDVLRLGPAADAAWSRLVEATEASGGGPVSRAAFESWRVERGIPVYGWDFDEGSLPQETGLVDLAVSFEKGCYMGQEVVARIHYRGHVNRQLRGLRLPSEATATDGHPLFRDGREVGRVSSPVRSPGFGSIALATVRREIEPGTRVSLSPDGEPAVTVVTLPFTVQ
ncbi:MAG: glycine cleavage T C-terminal barrel domain-containing protein [Gemmatimonadota bacterium]